MDRSVSVYKHQAKINAQTFKLNSAQIASINSKDTGAGAMLRHITSPSQANVPASRRRAIYRAFTRFAQPMLR
jgi:hypothetical protein